MKRATHPLLVVALGIAAAVAGAREFAMPQLVPATRMACRDVHAQENVAFAADAYSTPQKASLFHPAMLAHSVLPVLVVFTNEGDEPILLSKSRFQLVTRDRAKAEAFSLDDLRRALTALHAPGSRAQDKMPVPLPGKGSAHGGISSHDRDELQHAMLAARAVEPHASVQGFVFFDTTGLDEPAQGARLYVTGVTDARGQELMYFEVPLEESPSGQP